MCVEFLFLSTEPPIPASYYWYLLAFKKNQIYGVPPLVINGQARLLNMGFMLNDTWLSTTISSQDCLLKLDNCQKGFTIGIKLRIDMSLKYCKQPKYILDTGPSVKSQGVSLFIAGGMLVARVTSSKQFWQVGIRFHSI